MNSPIAQTLAAPVLLGRSTHVRWVIATTLFVVTAVNFADRATLSITATSITKQFGINAVTMGYLFSAFGWSYVLGQIPGGWLLDRYGSKTIYAASLFLWSLFTLLQGCVSYVFVTASYMVFTLFLLRFCVGLAESPSMPANSRIVAAWFPVAERGRAVGLINSSQYFATALFAPIMSWITVQFGWQQTFLFMGLLGILLTPVILKVIYNPRQHQWIGQAEFEHIRRGGALVETDQPGASGQGVTDSTWWYIGQLLRNRLMLGVFIGQYCITTLTYFFLTWFPVYLVQARGMSILKVGFVAILPAICGFIGGVLGGVFSDSLLKRGYSLTLARKTPIVAGMLLSMVMIGCNYVNTEWLVVSLMALAFFGKGLGALGWTVIADTAPRQIIGLSGGVFNLFGNTAGITTPIIIGYIVNTTGSFNGALVFVGANALLAIVSYLLIVPRIERLELAPPTP